VSLEPLAEYLADIAEYFGPSTPVTMACRECGGSVEFWPPDPGGQLNVDCPNGGCAIEIIG
jgi:hypothetical protein